MTTDEMPEKTTDDKILAPRVSMITLGVSSVPSSANFYASLGFPKLDYPSQDVAFFTLNGTWLGLYGRDNLAKDAGVAPDGGGFSGLSLSHNVQNQHQVRTIFEKAVAAGATPTKAPQETHWGGYHAYFSDLDGFLWEIAHNPFMWVGPED